jgi:hypothetical protein
MPVVPAGTKKLKKDVACVPIVEFIKTISRVLMIIVRTPTMITFPMEINGVRMEMCTVIQIIMTITVLVRVHV